MRKTLLFLLGSLAVLSAAWAGEQSRGLYRLQRFIYADGSSQMPNFNQYKYVADSVGLLVSGSRVSEPGRWGNAVVEIRENYPLTPTGDQPQGADGHGVRIFNVAADRFYFKWYNDRWPGMGHMGEFITELYSRSGIEPQMKQFFDILEDRFDHKANRITGWWTCMETVANPDGTGLRTSVQPFWKIYAPGMSVVARRMNDVILQCNFDAFVRYEGDSVVFEGGHRCHIRWIDADSHTLTFTQPGGTTTTELWVRGGLPQIWQTVFGTSVPFRRDAVQCLKEAAMACAAAVSGNDFDGFMVRMYSLLDEAREKNVSLRDYANIVSALGYVLTEKHHLWKPGLEFCSRQLQCIDDYVRAGHERDVSCDVFLHILEGFRSVALYRLGDVEEGRRQIKERLAAEERDIRRFRGLTGAEGLVSTLNRARLSLYCSAYDVIGADLTLIFLDALPVVAPDVLERSILAVQECRGNCLLLRGEKEAARRVWEQIRERQPDYFEFLPEDSPMRQAFGQ